MTQISRESCSDGTTLNIYLESHSRSHEWPQGSPGDDVVNIYPRNNALLRLERIKNSNIVKILSGHYKYNDEIKVFKQTSVPLSQYRPLEEGTKKAVLLTLNKEDGTIGIFEGKEVPITQVKIDIPKITYLHIPIAFVRLIKNQQTIEEKDIFDLRPFIDNGIDQDPYKDSCFLIFDKDASIYTANVPSGIKLNIRDRSKILTLFPYKNKQFKFRNIEKNIIPVTLVDCNLIKTISKKLSGKLVSLKDVKVVDKTDGSVPIWNSTSNKFEIRPLEDAFLMNVIMKEVKFEIDNSGDTEIIPGVEGKIIRILMGDYSSYAETTVKFIDTLSTDELSPSILLPNMQRIMPPVYSKKLSYYKTSSGGGLGINCENSGSKVVGKLYYIYDDPEILVE